MKATLKPAKKSKKRKRKGKGKEGVKKKKTKINKIKSIRRSANVKVMLGIPLLHLILIHSGVHNDIILPNIISLR